MKTQVRLLNLIFLLLIFNNLKTIDNVHFYHSARFQGQPRLICDKLTTIETWINGGQTNKGFTANKTETSLLNIYGNINIRDLAKNIPNNINNLATTLITDLWDKSPNYSFGNFETEGFFENIETGINWTQNFKHGFFTKINIPIRKLRIRDIRFIDKTPDNTPLPTGITSASWVDFKNNFKQEIEKYNIKLNSIQKSGFGDITLQAGWAYSQQKSRLFDFIDTEIKFGFLLPTGKKSNINEAFDLSSGYDNFWGFPISFDAAAGLYEWLTFGTHIDAIFFIDDTKEMRMQTDLNQKGPIKLAKGVACVERGTVWNTNFFLKSDHIPWGLSMTLGYSYNKGESTVLTPEDPLFNYDIVNLDEAYQEWSLHVLNVIFEYDFSLKSHPKLPYVSFNIDVPFRGRRAFKTRMTGTTLGINFIWSY